MNKVAKRVLLWVAILGILAVITFLVTAPVCSYPMWQANERSACTSLMTLATAEEYFRVNDSDENKIKDFWRADLAGLYSLKPQGEQIKLIELSCALADDRPKLPAGQRTMKHGYWLRAIRFADEIKSDPKRFAFCAFPDEYPKSGKRTFIISHDRAVYRKDLGSARGIDAWPANPGKEGWEKLD